MFYAAVSISTPSFGPTLQRHVKIRRFRMRFNVAGELGIQHGSDAFGAEVKPSTLRLTPIVRERGASPSSICRLRRFTQPTPDRVSRLWRRGRPGDSFNPATEFYRRTASNFPTSTGAPGARYKQIYSFEVFRWLIQLVGYFLESKGVRLVFVCRHLDRSRNVDNK